MTLSIQTIGDNKNIFKAQYFNFESSSTLEKIKKIAYNIFSVVFFPLGVYRILKHGLHCLSGLFIAQGQTSSKSIRKVPEHRKNLVNFIKDVYKDNFNEIKEIFIKTADNVKLNGMTFKVKNPKGTIIFFGGSAFFYEDLGRHLNPLFDLFNPLSFRYSHDLDDELLKQASKAGFNVVLFNTRGSGISAGRATEDGLQLDGEAILQYTKKELTSDEEKIILYGHSLGGAIATKLASKHSKVKLVNDRSFSNLFNAIKEIAGRVAAYAVLFLGSWEFDSAEAWKNTLGKKVMVYGELDNNISETASLKHVFPTDADKTIVLKNKHHMSNLSIEEFNKIFSTLIDDCQPIGIFSYYYEYVKSFSSCIFSKK